MRLIVATASMRILTRGALGRQHDGVGALIDGGRHVGDLGARRQRREDHRFEHLRRDDDRLAEPARGAGDALLQARHLLERHFDAEIAARHHQRVGDLDDLVETGDRLRLLDLGHDQRARAGDLLDLEHVLRPLHEGDRHPIDALLQRRVEIGAVLRSSWR